MCLRFVCNRQKLVIYGEKQAEKYMKNYYIFQIKKDFVKTSCFSSGDFLIFYFKKKIFVLMKMSFLFEWIL